MRYIPIIFVFFASLFADSLSSIYYQRFVFEKFEYIDTTKIIPTDGFNTFNSQMLNILFGYEIVLIPNSLIEIIYPKYPTNLGIQEIVITNSHYRFEGNQFFYPDEVNMLPDEIIYRGVQRNAIIVEKDKLIISNIGFIGTNIQNPLDILYKTNEVVLFHFRKK